MYYTLSPESWSLLHNNAEIMSYISQTPLTVHDSKVYIWKILNKKVISFSLSTAMINILSDSSETKTIFHEFKNITVKYYILCVLLVIMYNKWWAFFLEWLRYVIQVFSPILLWYIPVSLNKLKGGTTNRYPTFLISTCSTIFTIFPSLASFFKVWSAKESELYLHLK